MYYDVVQVTETVYCDVIQVTEKVYCNVIQVTEKVYYDVIQVTETVYCDAAWDVLSASYWYISSTCLLVLFLSNFDECNICSLVF